MAVTIDHFEPGLDRLQEEMPSTMAGALDPNAELYRWLASLGSLLDGLSLAAEQLYADASLTTASDAALREQWAPLFGIGNEVANLNGEQLRGYIKAWIFCDGSVKSIENLLLAIIGLNPANGGGAVLTFDAGGAGLTFPSSGGLTMYQSATKPDQTVGFVFPIDGSGLTFPDQALYFPVDGSGLPLAATFPNVPDLTFPNSAWVVLTEAFSSYALAVTVKSYLAFDRPAFKRAIARFAQAHTTTSYTEVNT